MVYANIINLKEHAADAYENMMLRNRHRDIRMRHIAELKGIIKGRYTPCITTDIHKTFEYKHGSYKMNVFIYIGDDNARPYYFTFYLPTKPYIVESAEQARIDSICETAEDYLQQILGSGEVRFSEKDIYDAEQIDNIWLATGEREKQHNILNFLCLAARDKIIELSDLSYKLHKRY